MSFRKLDKQRDALRAVVAVLAVMGIIGLTIERGWPFATIALFGISAVCIWYVRKVRPE